MRISKLVKDRIQEVTSITGSIRSLDGRCSGDTTGVALTVIGDCMRKDRSYTVKLRNYLPLVTTTVEVDNLMARVKSLVFSMELQHFSFNNQDKTATYSPWM